MPSVSFSFSGLASDDDVARLGVAVCGVRLVLPTEPSAHACGCGGGDTHGDLTLVGLAPTDPLRRGLERRLGRELLSGNVVVDDNHDHMVGSRLRAPGLVAQVVGAVPSPRPVVLTTLTDLTRIVLASPASAARVETHVVADHARGLPTAAAGWRRTTDLLAAVGVAA